MFEVFRSARCRSREYVGKRESSVSNSNLFIRLIFFFSFFFCNFLSRLSLLPVSHIFFPFFSLLEYLTPILRSCDNRNPFLEHHQREVSNLVRSSTYCIAW